jgi:hypothetical protein
MSTINTEPQSIKPVIQREPEQPTGAEGNGVHPINHTIKEFGALITAAWNRQVENIVEIGRLFEQAFQQLEDGQWSRLFEKKGLVPCSKATADMYRKIARHPVLANSKFSRNHRIGTIFAGSA